MLNADKYYHSNGPERVGFILKDGTEIEVTNICPDPESGFEVSAEDLVKYEDAVVATWHTHPGAPSNLSVDDYNGFKNWPHLKHFIIGEDGVQCFKVENGTVMKDE